MRSAPNGYLTLAAPVRKRSRVTLDEAKAGIVDWWARLWDLVLGSGADRLAWQLITLIAWLVTVLWAYNVGLRAG